MAGNRSSTDLSTIGSSTSTTSMGRRMSQDVSGSCKRVYAVRNSAGGNIYFAWQRSAGSLLASTIEGSHTVFIYTRLGNTLVQLPLKGNCAGLAWDQEGDYLAIMTEGSSILVLWDSHSKRMTEIESNLKDPGTNLVWSKSTKVLAYTTVKGNLLIYNHNTLRKIPIIGKHSKRIIEAAWSNDNMLALATIDNTMSINTIDGDAVRTVSLRAKPSDLKFGHVKEDQSNSAIDNTVSLIVGDRTLYLLKVEDGSGSPMELGFQPRYGNIVSHEWHGDGYILCSFSGGFIVMISSHHREIGSELVLTELRSEPLRASALSQRASKFAVCYGDNLVEVREASDTNQIVSRVNLAEAESRIRPAIKCSWNFDGQLLAVVTTGGDLHVFLTTVPMLAASHGKYIVRMSSLCDVTIHTFDDANSIVTERPMRLDIEPTALAVSKLRFVVFANNRAWCYSFQQLLDNLSEKPVFIKDYNFMVNEICMNDSFIAARVGDKVHISIIRENVVDFKDTRTFPDSSSRRDAKITAHLITPEFLIYALDNASIKLFSLTKWTDSTTVTTFTGSLIKRMFVDLTDTFLVIVHRNSSAYVYDMAEDLLYELPEFPTRNDGVLWDMDKKYRKIFVVYSLTSLQVQIFILRLNMLVGTYVEYIGSFSIFSRLGCKPIVLRGGHIYYQTPVGEISSTDFIYIDHSTDDEHDSADGEEIYSFDRIKRKLGAFINFGCFDEAFKYCVQIDKRSLWKLFGLEALKALELTFAKRAYYRLKDAGMVSGIKNAMKEGHLSLICGHVGALISEFDLAQECYITSGNPLLALEMRMLVFQWKEAEELASKYAPDYVCEVTCKYAMELELALEHEDALHLYAKAFEHSQSYETPYKNEVDLCLAGIARTSIRCNEHADGMKIALSSGNTDLIKECAEALEEMKKYAEAAIMYEECSEFEKAAPIHIRLKNWERVGIMLRYIKSPIILSEYARAKEGEAFYLEAAESYERAGDIESACRNYLEIGQADHAIRLVTEHKNISGAFAIAKYFEARQDFDTAIRFLIMSNCNDEALALAFRQGSAELYVSIILDLASDIEYGGKGIANLPPRHREDIKTIAQYFEDQLDHIKAGKYFSLAGNHRKAFVILMKSASSGVTYDEDNLLKLLSEVSAQCNDSHYEKQFVEFCLGEKDGIPKDASHVLNYYLAVKKYSEATKATIIVACENLNSGNYKVAHSALFSTSRTLRDNMMHISRDLKELLITVHYYVLIIRHTSALGSDKADPITMAKLHFRLSQEIQRFPKHIISILTQAVIWCQKAGFEASGMDVLRVLMKPENRSQIQSQYKSRFETMIRKAGKTQQEDAGEPMSPCPNCNADIQNFQLCCNECRADIPMCIASGRHITIDDLSACPRCDFPCIREQMFHLIKDEPHPTCPMCEEPIECREFVLINDPRPYLGN